MFSLAYAVFRGFGWSRCGFARTFWELDNQQTASCTECYAPLALRFYVGRSSARFGAVHWFDPLEPSSQVVLQGFALYFSRVLVLLIAISLTIGDGTG